MITKRVEEAVARKMYWALRLSLGVKGKRVKGKRKLKDRPTHWNVEILDPQPNEQVPIDVRHLPKFYPVIRFPAPGILRGDSPSDLNPKMQIDLKGNPSELCKMMSQLGAGRLETEHFVLWGDFARLIAKICHAFAVGQLGLSGLTFFLPALILGHSTHLAHYVGCSADTSKLEGAHDLRLLIRTIERDVFLCAQTTLLGPDRFPTYEAVVGKITDPAVIRRLSAASTYANSRA
ncbi:MAG: hypothetical protein WA418_17380 [Bradyrhizobium sp.]